MSKTFNIYCDESTHLINDRHPYMLLGYVSIAYPQIKMAREQIKAIKAKHNYVGEQCCPKRFIGTMNMRLL